jgi:hypothetical protein
VAKGTLVVANNLGNLWRFRGYTWSDYQRLLANKMGMVIRR